MAIVTAVKRRLMTVGPYTASRTFIAPVTTSKIESITGKGASGTPSYSVTRWREKKTFTVDYEPGYGTDNTTETYSFKSLSESDGVDYCDPPIYVASAHATTQYCYDYTLQTTTYPATTGASVTAFGKTFPGGVGGPATPVTFTDVPVSGGSSYPLNIPTGGEITTFSYYE